MSTCRILVVEDEFIIAEDVLSTLEEMGYEDTRHAFDYDEAITILGSWQPDLALLDINLEGEKDGIEVAKSLRAKIEIPIIFLTSYADKATIDRAKTVNPDGYLVKPFSYDDLFSSIEIALHHYAGPPVNDRSDLELKEADEEMLIKDAFFIKKKDMFYKVRFADILYISADRSYLEIVTEKERFLVRISLNKLMDYQIPNLVRTHRSHAINLDHIEAVSSQNVAIAGITIPIGRSYRDDLQKRFQTLI